MSLKKRRLYRRRTFYGKWHKKWLWDKPDLLPTHMEGLANWRMWRAASEANALVKDDVYTSVHLKNTNSVKTAIQSLGLEEITREIPNVGEDALKDLEF